MLAWRAVHLPWELLMVSRWYETDRQGTALGIFGMGNVGAAVTNFGATFSVSRLRMGKCS